ncbi:helix-turn-helix domain-containing protein [Halorussus halobius]|uniref:helix-turn-helix domain-containing protein n=1 Tax=Halorussus halobius TaxID=1710537 RepID=UPI001091AAAE|nr:helix-turn-helix domain-containing protein [Halorussus halobius]
MGTSHEPVGGGGDETSQLTLEVWHPECWTLETTAAVDAGLLAHSVHEVEDLINARLTAYADTHDEIDALVEAIAESELTQRVERIHHFFNPNLRTDAAGNVTEELLVRYDSANSIHDAFLSRGFIPDEEIRISDGYEYWTVVVTASRQTVRTRLDEIRREMDAEITVRGMKSPETTASASETGNRLSERQLEVFELARREGYYSWPRETSATELAEQLDVAKPTVLEHLRKAEAKLLDPDG